MSNADPTSICNQALDAAMIDFTLGDIEEGTREAQVCLRAYRECLSQLLRGAPWDFARKQVPLLLLADATGQTANVGTTVPSPQFVYEYAYPIDCARVRYIPWNPFLNAGAPAGNISTDTTVPLTTNQGTPMLGQAIRPSRFLITNDPNYSAAAGSSYMFNQGQSPVGNTVILSNVPQATCVYTFEALYPSLWDHLFRAAMVAYLASEIVGPLTKDKRFAVSLRTQQIAIAKQKIMEARVADGNEMTASSDITVDWMQYRRVGGTWTGIGPYGGSGAPGDWGCWGGAGWGGSVGFGDGSAY